MPDYVLPDVVEKRVRFFDGQFLQDQDFIDEQKYHLDRERRISRLLRITGIAQGLAVIARGSRQVTVKRGRAVDGLGRPPVLASDLALQLPAQFANQHGIDLHVVYQEMAVDMAMTGGKSERRWRESPKIAAVAPDGTVAVAPDGASTTWDGPTVLLAQLSVDPNGTVSVDSSAAQYAGQSLLGNLGVGTVDPGRYRLKVEGGDTALGGGLTVTGNVGIGTSSPEAKLDLG